ncbi:MAG: hypothetical protein JST54_28695 [Deltaproteobacteria bacterium]|nr:hypothetical protein [Deltaproteobacteria bacterium]
MRKLLILTAPLLAVLWGCSGNSKCTPPPDGGVCVIVGNGQDAGHDAGPSLFQTTDLTIPEIGGGEAVVAAMSPTGRIGIAYYGDTSSTNRNIEYVEYDLTTGQQLHANTIATGYDRVSDLAITWSDAGASSSAYVAFLGNDPNVNEAIETNGGDGGVFWHQSDVGLATIDSNGNMTLDFPAHNGFDATNPCGDPVDDRDSPVIGLSPALAWDGNQLVIMFRNVHAGQFPIQDYGKSSLGAVSGTPGNPGTWTQVNAICGSDNGGSFVSVGIGEGTSFAVNNGVGVAATGAQSDIDGIISGLYTVQYSQGAWTGKQALFTNPPLANEDSIGPRIVADSTVGFGLAWADMSTSKVYYSSSSDGQNWAPYTEAYGAGTGGWYPSLAFDVNHLPALAFYVCSQEPGVNQGSCPPAEDELRLANYKPNGHWPSVTIDSEGGYYPTLMYNGGQAVVVYRTLAGGIRIAMQVQ